jgi:hypothetical protein
VRSTASQPVDANHLGLFSSRIARPLIEGLRTEAVCKSTRAAELFPAIRPMGDAAAIERTLTRTLPDDSLRETLPCRPAHVFTRRDGVLCDVRQAVADASPKDVFSVITHLGGSNGYLYAKSLRRIRGWLDRCLGGVGMKRSPGSAHLNKNDHIDFWYVQDLEADRHLLLREEMKLPNRAWLEFLVSSQPSGRTLVRCCTWFEPCGLLGELYWRVLYPVHILIFRGVVQAVCRKAARAMQAAPAAVR